MAAVDSNGLAFDTGKFSTQKGDGIASPVERTSSRQAMTSLWTEIRTNDRHVMASPVAQNRVTTWVRLFIVEHCSSSSTVLSLYFIALQLLHRVTNRAIPAWNL